MQGLGPLVVSLGAVLGSAPHGRAVPAERYEPRSFLGYACEDDCERHKAGFAWAESRAVAVPAACTPLPAPEAEGCRAFVEEPLAPEQAGRRWAVENEIGEPRLCGGAGERFRQGCLAAVGIEEGAPP